MVYFGPLLYFGLLSPNIAWNNGRNMPGHRISHAFGLSLLLDCLENKITECIKFDVPIIYGLVQCRGDINVFWFTSDVLWTILVDFGLLCSNSLGSECGMNFDLEWHIQDHQGPWKVLSLVAHKCYKWNSASTTAVLCVLLVGLGIAILASGVCIYCINECMFPEYNLYIFLHSVL